MKKLLFQNLWLLLVIAILSSCNNDKRNAVENKQERLTKEDANKIAAWNFLFGSNLNADTANSAEVEKNFLPNRKISTKYIQDCKNYYYNLFHPNSTNDPTIITNIMNGYTEAVALTFNGTDEISTTSSSSAIPLLSWIGGIDQTKYNCVALCFGAYAETYDEKNKKYTYEEKDLAHDVADYIHKGKNGKTLVGRFTVFIVPASQKIVNGKKIVKTGQDDGFNLGTIIP